MEEKILKLIKLANELNEKQNKVFTEISYKANDEKLFELIIREKNDYSCFGRLTIKLKNKEIINWDDVIKLFENIIGGLVNE